jgi:hypothetical protein
LFLVVLGFVVLLWVGVGVVRGGLLLVLLAVGVLVWVWVVVVDEEIGKLAEYYQSTREEVQESLAKQGGTGTIENNLKTRKSIEALIAKAKVSDGPWVDDSLGDVPAEAKADSEEKPKKAAKAKTAKAKSDDPKEPKKKTAKSKSAE